MSEGIWIITGAGIAIIGGCLGDEFRAWRERSRERDAIKISLVDELQEIVSTIEGMHEVWEETQILSRRYVTTLLNGTSVYNNFRMRFFLIKDSKLRKEIHDFYKKLQNTATKVDDKLGNLSESEEQSKFDDQFQTISNEAKALQKKLDKNQK
jgi:hypothetical protein